MFLLNFSVTIFKENKLNTDPFLKSQTIKHTMHFYTNPYVIFFNFQF